MKSEKKRAGLYIELQSIADRGVTIWLSGAKSSPKKVAKELLHEECDYMRDYIFEKDRLKELHFDKLADS